MIERMFAEYTDAVAYRQELKLLGFATKLELLPDGSSLVKGTRLK